MPVMRSIMVDVRLLISRRMYSGRSIRAKGPCAARWQRKTRSALTMGRNGKSTNLRRMIWLMAKVRTKMLVQKGRVIRNSQKARAFGGFVAIHHAVGKPTMKVSTVVRIDSDSDRQKIVRCASASATRAAAGQAAAARLVTVFGARFDTDEVIARAPEPMSENMLCSGTFEGGKTACSGDSGGPLVVPLDDGTFIQAGIVSWGLSAKTGEGCEEKALFSAYTKISKFVPWLNEVINANP